MGEPVYDVRVLSETGGLMRSSIGVSATYLWPPRIYQPAD
jgi:hypothetical protein